MLEQQLSEQELDRVNGGDSFTKDTSSDSTQYAQYSCNNVFGFEDSPNH